MKNIGITGNIGSGKTTVCKIFEVLGAKVFHADAVAKSFYNLPGNIEIVTSRFGEEILTNGKPDFSKIANLVFNDEEKLKWLNGIIHPFVREKFHEWREKQENLPYVLYEAAILHESGHYRNLDLVILVTAPEEVRIRRIMQRDGVSGEMALSRIRNQWPEDKKMGLSDHIIINDGRTMVLPQVLRLYKILDKL